MVLQPDRFLSELTSMYERSTEKGSVWVTMKRCECPFSVLLVWWFIDWIGVVAESESELMCCSLWAASLKGKAQLQKMEKKGKEVEYRCLVRASDGKKSISTSVL